MDPMNDQIIQLGARLLELAGKQTYNWVTTKMQLAKQKDTMAEQQTAYEEIIMELLNGKHEMEQIAREYKRLYDQISISDEDIEYLQKTIRRVLDVLLNQTPYTKTEDVESYEMLINLINKDTLKTMQLLGFNYKEAIGEPLTEITSSAIYGAFNKNTKKQNKPQKKKRKNKKRKDKEQIRKK